MTLFSTWFLIAVIVTGVVFACFAIGDDREGDE